MSKHIQNVQFYADHLFVLRESIANLEAGTLLAQDHYNNWFFYTSWKGTAQIDQDSQEGKNWPRRSKFGIQLYRDYWRHFSASVGSKWHNDLLAAPKTQIR
jgi:hypothetical protein